MVASVAGWLLGIRPSVNPPDDLVYGSLGEFLEPSEKRLLRLSLLAARALPVSAFSHDDKLMVDALTQSLTKDGGLGWDSLLTSDDIDRLVSDALAAYVPEDYSGTADIVDSPDDGQYIEIEVPKRFATQELQVIDSALVDEDVTLSTVVLAWLGPDRVLLYRRDLNLQLPSLRWLIENRFESGVQENIRGTHYGTQDAIYFRIESSSKRRLRAPMRRLASDLAMTTTGGRYLMAAVARNIAELANTVLEAIDLRQAYTGAASSQLEVLARISTSSYIQVAERERSVIP